MSSTSHVPSAFGGLFRRLIALALIAGGVWQLALAIRTVVLHPGTSTIVQRATVEPFVVLLSILAIVIGVVVWQAGED